jgi:3'(2'), 5'-bisphosphate nucleotidase
MNSLLEKERETAVRAVIAASRLCLGVHASLIEDTTMVKGDKSPVTIADYGSQAVVCKILGQAFPHDPIVAEEDSAELAKPENAETLKAVTRHVNEILHGASPRQVCSWIDSGSQEPSERFWTLDPIDGTKGFLRGDQYAIALALIERGEVRLGVLGCPNLPISANLRGKQRGAILMALRSQGAAQADLEGSRESSITVSKAVVPSEARLTESFESAHSDHASHQRIARQLNITNPPLRMDSQAKYAVLAKGAASIYLRLPSPETPDYRERIWDHAAGSIIMEEAGGRVTDAYGKALDFSQGRRLEENQGVVATNGFLHDTVLEAVRSTLKTDRSSETMKRVRGK